jgi:hypothetical protein
VDGRSGFGLVDYSALSDSQDGHSGVADLQRFRPMEFLAAENAENWLFIAALVAGVLCKECL